MSLQGRWRHRVAASVCALLGLMLASGLNAAGQEQVEAALKQPGRAGLVGEPDAAGPRGPLAPMAADGYMFDTATNASLVDMSSGTTLIAAVQDDTASSVVPIGFDFFFQGVRHDQFSVNSNGTLRLGTTQISNTLYDPLGQAGQSLITAYGADQRTHTSGRVHYRLIGGPPNRTLVVEWMNMQSNFSAGGSADLTYQVHLSETSGAIRFVYGAMAMSAAGAGDVNSASPQFGFSSGNVIGTVGSITAAQSGTPAPTYNSSSATPVNNSYVAGPIPVLDSSADGSRRSFSLTPLPVLPPGGPITFTAVTSTAMTLNWGDSPNELGYAVYISPNGVDFSLAGITAQNATSYTASGLTGGVAYMWRVYAFNEGSTAFISGVGSTPAPTPVTSVASGLWSSPATWSTGSIPDQNSAVTIAAGHEITIDTSAIIYQLNVDGTLRFEQTTARTLTVGFDVNVSSSGSMASSPAGTQVGHALSIGRNLTNEGVIVFSTNGHAAGATLAFTGAGDSLFTGGGAASIRTLSVNKTTGPDTVVRMQPSTFLVRGVSTDTVVGGWLALTNGTLRLSGTFAGTSRVFSAAAYTIPATAGFWLDNPNYVVAGQNGSPTNAGLLRVSNGTFNVGTSTGNSMGLATGSSTRIEGGGVNASGRL